MHSAENFSNFRTYFREIWFLMGDDRKRLPWLMFLFLCISVVDIVSIGVVGPYIALVINPDTHSSFSFITNYIKPESNDRQMLITLLGFVLIVIFTIKTAVAIAMNRMIFKFSLGRAAQLRIDLMKAYMDMPYEVYLGKNSAQMLQAAQDYVGQFVEQSIIPLLRLISEGIISVAILCFLAWANGYALALLIGLIVPSAIAYDKFFNSRILNHGKQANLKMGGLLKALKEATSGLKELRVLGATGYFQDVVKDNAKSNAAYIVKSKTIITAPRYLLELCLIVFVVILTVFMSRVYGDAGSVIPVLGMFGVAAMRLIPSANTCIAGISKLRVGQHATNMLFLDLAGGLRKPAETHEYTEHSSSSNSTHTSFRSMELRNVKYRYPEAKEYALEDVSFSFISGESIGIIGRSGAGKSTLVDVMLGLLEPINGSILVNDVPIQNCLAAWRSNVAYLPQQVFIADSSVQCNVALGVPEEKINTADVWNAIEQARLGEIIKSMPDGLDTMLGEHGVRLSGGQRQRIALARAIYHDRNVLVMDESTSALDSETEKEVIDSIKTMRGKKTLIVIAHRMSIIEQCDRVYQLNNGAIELCSDIKYKSP